MEALSNVIDTTPIIDHHAHNLLLPQELKARQLLSITTEASDGALKHTPSSISHIRAVKQLSGILGCKEAWGDVQAAIDEKRKEPNDVWARSCFEGIETVLIDDGLDENTVHPWDWHHRLTRSKCKRIVRIEKLAEALLSAQIKEASDGTTVDDPLDYSGLFNSWKKAFVAAIADAIRDPDVVGFKSVICYRKGLAIPEMESRPANLIAAFKRLHHLHFDQLEDEILSPYFVHLTAELIGHSPLPHKPFQFHTGLGDNDIMLSLASPSHMQPFIKTYPDVPIVLLHAAYPFTKEAGYLASVYENVFLDIGEVFPMISRYGQESVIKESLELCPSQKLLWSTDGHWFPETYVLAVIQVREAMKQVLGEMLSNNSLDFPQATRVVQDIFFNTSNHLYNLELNFEPLGPLHERLTSTGRDKIARLDVFAKFLQQHPDVKFLRLQWLDYTSTLRVRVIPVGRALELFSNQKSIGIVDAVLGLLQTDAMVPGFSPVGEHELVPCFESLRMGERAGYATVQGEFRNKDGSQMELCPRTPLRLVVERAAKHDITFLLGFELEVVFMSSETVNGVHVYGKTPVGAGHSWSNATALRNPKILNVIEEILAALEKSRIDLQQVHPENAPGQYEFVTGPLPPLESVDTLLATREIIYAVAEKHSLKATFIPKPYPYACGTGAHVHMSVSPEDAHTSFYAGVLKYLRSIAAFAYCNDASYDRVQDSVWSGGRYVTWGTQNRETPLRKIEGCHWEMKCLDGLANMYLAMAATFGAGLEGILTGESLTHKDCQADPALLSQTGRKLLGIEKMLPESFAAALQTLENDEGMKQILGKKLVDAYVNVKRTEADMLNKMDAEERRMFLLARY